MGGAKPKLLVQDAGAFWIAKFPEKGDPLRLLAANEHVMLEMAKDCGIDAAASLLHSLPDGRQILLVRRFDLLSVEGGATRKRFASAYTVLGLGNPHEDAKKKSYLRFADEVMRWTGRSYSREIWQRVVFNAMVGNVDDHPRNHALIRSTDGWELAPAFDIVASDRKDQVALAMRFHAEGAVATPESLLASALLFGVPAEEAVAEMQQMAGKILDTWETRLRDAGAETADLPKLDGAFKMARLVASHIFDLNLAGQRRGRSRYRPSSL